MDNSIKLKIKALLNKTIENGATEEEANLAISKATELMAKYQLGLSDLDVKKSNVKVASAAAYPEYLRNFAATEMSGAVGALSETCVWFNSETMAISFCGLEEDIQFAMWLSSYLSEFALKQATDWWRSSNRGTRTFTANERAKMKKAFIAGFALRIDTRVAELIKERKEFRESSTGTSLVPIEDLKNLPLMNTLARQNSNRRDHTNQQTQPPSEMVMRQERRQILVVPQTRRLENAWKEGDRGHEGFN